MAIMRNSVTHPPTTLPRLALIGIAGLLLGGEAISAVGSLVAPKNAAKTLSLSGDGFSADGEPVRFGKTSKAQAIMLVGMRLGTAMKIGSHGECGNGDTIGFAKFSGGFELSFVHGKLSGWTADGPDLKTSRGAVVGMTLSALRKSYPDIDVDPGDEKNGGLGPSFQREGGPNGALTGTKPTSRVTGLYAGETCLPGI